MLIRSLKRIIIKILRNIDPNWSLNRNLKRLGSYENIPFIKPYSKTRLTNNTFIGKNCNFNGMIIQGGGKVIIGDNFHSGEDLLIITQNHNYDKGDKLPYDKEYKMNDTIIEDNVWIGSNVIIIGGINIGEGAVIQAGSVVIRDVPKYSVIGGHPAKIFKYRDIKHYKKLKKEKKFH